MTTICRSYGHVIRKGDEDWVKKCMEFRVESRTRVGRPRRTWLESVEECACCACDPSVHFSVPFICFVYVVVCRKLSPHLRI